MTLTETATRLAAISVRIDTALDDELADRQYALEQAQRAIDDLRRRVGAAAGKRRPS